MIKVQLSEETADALLALAPTAEDALELLARAAATGVRRPESWERSWLAQVCGVIREPLTEDTEPDR